MNSNQLLNPSRCWTYIEISFPKVDAWVTNCRCSNLFHRFPKRCPSQFVQHWSKKPPFSSIEVPEHLTFDMNFHHLCPQISWESWAIRAAPRIPLTNSIASNSCQCQHGPELLRDHGRGGTRWIWCTRRQLRLLFGGLESGTTDVMNSFPDFFKWLKWTLGGSNGPRWSKMITWILPTWVWIFVF